MMTNTVARQGSFGFIGVRVENPGLQSQIIFDKEKPH